MALEDDPTLGTPVYQLTLITDPADVLLPSDYRVMAVPPDPVQIGSDLMGVPTPVVQSGTLAVDPIGDPASAIVQRFTCAYGNYRRASLDADDTAWGDWRLNTAELAGQEIVTAPYSALGGGGNLNTDPCYRHVNTDPGYWTLTNSWDATPVGFAVSTDATLLGHMNSTIALSIDMSTVPAAPPGIGVNLAPPEMPIVPGSIIFASVPLGHTDGFAGATFVEVIFRDSTGNLITDGGVQVIGFLDSTSVGGDKYGRLEGSAVAPVGAVTAQLDIQPGQSLVGHVHVGMIFWQMATPDSAMLVTEGNRSTTAGGSLPIYLSPTTIIHVTISGGHTAITDFGGVPFQMRLLRFDAGITIVNDAAHIHCPGDRDIVTETNDLAWVYTTSTGVARLLYTRWSGKPVTPTGDVITSGTAVAGQTQLTTSKAMAPGTEDQLLVWVGGQIQDSSQYTCHGDIHPTLGFAMGAGDKWRIANFG